MAALGDRATRIRRWLAADWRRAAAAVIVVTVAAAVGIVAGGMIQRDPEGVAATSTDPTPSVGPSSTPEPSPSAAPTESAPPASAAPTPSVTPTPVQVSGWTPIEIPGIAWVSSIAERDGRLVAVGHQEVDRGAAAMAYSDDGVSWAPVDLSQLDLDGVRVGQIVAGDPGFVAFGMRMLPDGMAEDVYFFSADGSQWQPAGPPEECAAGYSPQAVGSGFVSFGTTCVMDGMPPPGPMRVLTSTDGRSWTSRLDDTIASGPWASDGERIVMLAGCCDGEGAEEASDVAISDDAAATWREIPDAFPAGVTVYSMSFGHDRYVAEASWLIRPGDPDHAVCVSDTGEAWTCEVLSPTGVPPDELRAIGPVAATPTGFVSLKWTFDDLFAPSGSSMILGTSADGLAWTFATVPALKDTFLGGLVATRHGLFVWGSTDTQDGSSLPQLPVLLVHQGRLP